MGEQDSDEVDRDVSGGACFTMHGNFRVFARAIMALNRVGEELYLEPNEEGLALRALNSSKSAYATFLFSSTFFVSCDLTRIKNDDYNLCRISMKCALSAFRSAKSMDKAVLSCRMFINPRADSMLVQLTHTYGKCFIWQTTLSNLFAQIHHDADEVMLCANGDSFLLRNFTSRELEPDKMMKTEAKVALTEFNRYSVPRATEVSVNLKEFKAFVNFAETYQAPVSIYFEQPGSPMVIALESDVNFTAELVVATIDLDNSIIEPNYAAPLEVESQVPSSGSARPKRARSTSPPLSPNRDYSVPSAKPEDYAGENLPVTPPPPIKSVTARGIASQLRERFLSPFADATSMSSVQVGVKLKPSTQRTPAGECGAATSKRSKPNARTDGSTVEDSVLSLTRSRTSPISRMSKTSLPSHAQISDLERARSSPSLHRATSPTFPRTGEIEAIGRSSSEGVRDENAKDDIVDKNGEMNKDGMREKNGAVSDSDEEMFPESPSPPPTKSYRRFFLACSQKTLHASQLFVDKTIIAPNTQPDSEML
ncbi:Cell cycle checkpoint control protein RAD9A [Toxocara canis]|uniref:Cell cycle checkpoint control protein RAD9A n=1 Tax=Toxocara canis TaxID=6265 RepID=A0A0B2USV2_TOXCA|nr:Cell cycle checkpoint control protein RAD9A [Toxocara canis]